MEPLVKALLILFVIGFTFSIGLIYVDYYVFHILRGPPTSPSDRFSRQ